MKECFQTKTNFLKLFFFLSFYIIQTIQLEILEGLSSNKGNFNKRCQHRRKSHRKHFYTGSDRRVENYYSTEFKFEKFRIHFDFTYTLKYEEKIIKDLIIPPVKKLLESTLKTRRFPGKIRFPRDIEECEGVPIPKYLKTDGVDSDLIIIVSTVRGVKKYKYEQNLLKKGIGGDHKIKIKNSSMMDYFNHRLKRANTEVSINNPNSLEQRNLQNRINNTTISNLSDSTDKNTTSSNSKKLPWETNDGDNNVVGWSYMCIQDIYTLRPIAGVMQYAADLQITTKSIEEAVWTTLHEITHILVMDYDLYQDFIDNNFNRLGYGKTIKVKTKLKYLDKILEERHHLMDDYLAFGRFQRNPKFIDEGTIVKKKYETKNELYEDSSNNMKYLNEEDNSNNNDDIFNIKIDNKLKSGISRENEYFNFLGKNKQNAYSKGKEQNRIKFGKEDQSQDNLKITVVSEDSAENESILFKNSSNTKNFTSDFRISINTNLIDETKNNTLTNKEVKKNNTLLPDPTKLKPLISIDEIFNTGSYEEPTIKLPVNEDYYDLIIYPELNITTLATYIENFVDNTKIYIITPKVVEMAKTHYGCENLEGLELEHFGGLGSAYSHWSKRILNTDFLIADSYGEYCVSNISLAIFEDSGWYKVDYTKSDKLLWGKDKGCSFLSEKCVVKKDFINRIIASDSKDLSNKSQSSSHVETLINYDTKFKDEFCLKMNDEICSISNTFRATCGLKLNSFKIPKQYQYFDNPKIYAQNSFGDYCPYPVEWVDEESNPVGSCKIGKQIRKDLGEKVCENCRCFPSTLVEEKLYQLKKGNDKNLSFNRYKDIRAACYETRCIENSKGKIELVVYVNDSEILCPTEGGMVSVYGYNGYIKCPKTEIICDSMMDPKANFSKTSGYILSADIQSKILKFYNEYFDISFAQ